LKALIAIQVMRDCTRLLPWAIPKPGRMFRVPIVIAMPLPIHNCGVKW
jgi:hypothetical protein